jgi:hypothetical protein
MPYLDEAVDDAEPLTNFVVESNKFKKDKLPGGGTQDVVHYRAFMPDTDRERSVFRMDGLAQDMIALLGNAFVGLQRGKPILGWASIAAGAVRRSIPLKVRADEPPPRHAVIDAWPADVERCRALAMELASEALATRLTP